MKNNQERKKLNISKDSYTYRITKIIVEKPYTTFACCASFIFLLVIISIALGAMSLSESGQYDWTIASKGASKRYDAYADASSNVDLLNNTAGAQYERRSASDVARVFFYYEDRRGSEIFTSENLLNMCNIESVLVKDSNFINYCRLTNTADCEVATGSITQFFYQFNHIDSWNCTTLSSATINTKKNELYSLVSSPEGAEVYGFYVDKNTNIKSSNSNGIDSDAIGSSSSEDATTNIKKIVIAITDNGALTPYKVLEDCE